MTKSPYDKIPHDKIPRKKMEDFVTGDFVTGDFVMGDFVIGDFDPIPGGLCHQVIKKWGILSWGIMSLSGSGAGDFVITYFRES